MNEDHQSRGGTLPFARPKRASRDGGDSPIGGADLQALSEIVRQQPEVNISKTILLHRQVQAGRYPVNPSRLADRMLRFERRFQAENDSGGSSS